MRRRTLHIVSLVLCVIACALFIAALVIRNWFGVDPPQTITTNGSSNGQSVTYSEEFGLKLDPLRITVTAYRTTFKNGVQDGAVQEDINFDGPLTGVCDIANVKNNAGSACDYATKAAQVIMAIAIVAAAGTGTAALLLLLAIFTDTCRNKCCVCLLNLFICLLTLVVLVTSALWATLGTYGATTLNDGLPTFINGLLPSDATPVTSKGTFKATIALWLEVAGFGPTFLALIVNWMSCCCGQSEADLKRREEEDGVYGGRSMRTDVEMAPMPQSVAVAPAVPRQQQQQQQNNSNNFTQAQAPAFGTADNNTSPVGVPPENPPPYNPNLPYPYGGSQPYPYGYGAPGGGSQPGQQNVRM